MSKEIVLQALVSALAHAGLEYKSIHRVITAFLVSRDCGADSEWLADITLDRVAQKIYNGEEVRSMIPYAKKFAYLVWMEYCKDREKLRKAIRDWARQVPDRHEFEENIDLRRKCQEVCVTRLSQPERQLLVDYYITTKDREMLARDLGLAIATLRTQIHRLKLRLTACVEACRRSA